MTVIHTERLVLRHARLDDVAAFHAILSNPVAMRWWSSLPHASVEETRTWVEGMMTPDVGYILHPDAWGQGLAREAVGAAIDHVFAERMTDIATADVDPENPGSIRLLERLGFTRTGSAERTWNIGGEWKDSLYFALTRDAWQARLRTAS
ncbi:MAG: hypothetical protein B7Z01_05345 [Brevundimonas subvibrioides]|uniref:N-acetyltransferase domain-containing protein n=1 Tax=Brevundimonas subvibrioides TaxID=74313 RepID=A0A258FR26_9CAUL|nr:MAG: hypothetical protein B7Z01_05345 [Brevundimonas subvibrioides]